MKRKTVAFISAAALLIALLTGCGGTGGQSEPPSAPQTPTSGELAQGEESSTLEHNTDAADAPAVYMTTDISPEGLMAIYEALDWTPTGSVAVKLSTGEPPNSNYLRPELIKDVVQAVDGTIVECNTCYGEVVVKTLSQIKTKENTQSRRNNSEMASDAHHSNKNRKRQGLKAVRGVFCITVFPANPYISSFRPPGLSGPP